ncbi:MAG: hypothetical protein ABI193_10760 [Minicystis sp.]
MDTQDVVEKFRAEAAQEGGVRRGAEDLIEVYEARFGAMSAELRTAIERTGDDALLRAWLRLAATRSAEELAAAVRAVRAS